MVRLMRAALLKFLDTPSDATLLFLRVAAGAVLFPHGAQKLLGWFGGYGFEATLAGMQEHTGLPAFIVLLVILGESLGALGLVFGVASRFCALGAFVIMCGAMRAHLDVGFFMNWGGQNAGEGYEFHLLMMALVLPILVRGGGMLSLDRFLVNRIDALARP